MVLLAGVVGMDTASTEYPSVCLWYPSTIRLNTTYSYLFQAEAQPLFQRHQTVHEWALFQRMGEKSALSSPPHLTSSSSCLEKFISTSSSKERKRFNLTLTETNYDSNLSMYPCTVILLQLAVVLLPRLLHTTILEFAFLSLSLADAMYARSIAPFPHRVHIHTHTWIQRR